METITFTLPLGITLDSPINDLERAIYPQHKGLAELIGRIQDEEAAADEQEQETAADLMASEERADDLASALERLCDAVDDCDAAIDKFMDSAVDVPESVRDAIDIAFGALLAASETARGQL